ncbi:hypothetical protein [Sphingobium sp. CCH11-B1]|nr:hypothetical protein [Sphingobium sp. CCH11-B1]
MGNLTAFICWLLKSPRSKRDAGLEARRLKIRLDWAEFYFNTIGRMG